LYLFKFWANILQILPFVLLFAARYFVFPGVVVDGLGLTQPYAAA
jgi:hypothetical protein